MVRSTPRVRVIGSPRSTCFMPARSIRLQRAGPITLTLARCAPRPLPLQRERFSRSSAACAFQCGSFWPICHATSPISARSEALKISRRSAFDSCT